MDGVFMKKLTKLLGVCFLVAVLLWCTSVMADRQRLNEDLIRLHVVADSDENQDQQIKLQVKDAVVSYLQTEMPRDMNTQQAKAWLEGNLQQIQSVANRVLADGQQAYTAVVTLAQQAFPTREYDTFTLPAGVYESLRITIGEGEGRNWWCVVFPSLCLPATTDGFEDAAVGAGFSDTLTGSLTGQQPYQIRFFLLDCLGWLENFLFWG